MDVKEVMRQHRRALKVAEAAVPSVEERLTAVLRGRKREKTHSNCDERLETLRRAYPWSSYGTFCRDPEEWIPRIRSRSQNRLTADLVRWTYARFRVPAFMMGAFVPRGGTGRNLINGGARRQQADQSALFRRWFAIIGSGQSFHKQAGASFFSRAESGMFLQAPDQLCPQQAVWWARVRVAGASSAWATVLATSPLGDEEVRPRSVSDRALDVGRLLARIPELGSHHVSEVLDFLLANPQWGLAGRTVGSLLNGTKQWHRELALLKEVGDRTWPGTGIEPWEMKTGEGKTETVWRVRELVTGQELAAEGTAMRHCVRSYAPRCQSGSCAIWSVTRQAKIDLTPQRSLTLEMNENGTIVQMKGLANRMARSEELHVVSRWCQHHGFSIANPGARAA